MCPQLERNVEDKEKARGYPYKQSYQNSKWGIDGLKKVNYKPPQSIAKMKTRKEKKANE